MYVSVTMRTLIAGYIIYFKHILLPIFFVSIYTCNKIYRKEFWYSGLATSYEQLRYGHAL